MKNKKLIKLLSLLVVIIFFEVTALVTINFLRDNLLFKLKGQENIILKLDDTYNDPGYIATVAQADISDRVEIKNNTDTKTVGNYQVEYTLNFLNREYYLKRNIEVIDIISPTITLNGDPEINLYVDDKYVEAGAIAYDNYDGDITSEINIISNLDTTKAGEYESLYVSEDSSGNKATAKRKITIQNKPEPEPEPVREVQKQEIAYTDPAPNTSSDPIAEYIQKQNYDVSVGYYNLATGKQYFYQADKIYYGASLVKTLDAIYLYDKNMVDETVKYYIDRAISVSDNDAHIWLLNYIGRDILKNYGISLGATNTLSGNNNYGDTTVADQLVYFKKAYEIAKNNNEFKAPFINNFYNYIKIDGIDTMHKHGYYDQWYHDAGIVFDAEPYIVIILTNHGKGNRYEVIHNLTNLIYKYHKGEL